MANSAVLVLGRLPTVSNPKFLQAMAAEGMAARYPATEQAKLALVHLISRLYNNQTEGAAEALDALLGPVTDGNEVVCLGCTELSLAFPSHRSDAHFEYRGRWYVNAAVCHAREIFRACLN